jgi:hypothetical protein
MKVLDIINKIIAQHCADAVLDDWEKWAANHCAGTATDAQLTRAVNVELLRFNRRPGYAVDANVRAFARYRAALAQASYMVDWTYKEPLKKELDAILSCAPTAIYFSPGKDIGTHIDQLRKAVEEMEAK